MHGAGLSMDRYYAEQETRVIAEQSSKIPATFVRAQAKTEGSLYVATVYQIRPFEFVVISQTVDVPLANLEGQVIHNEERATASPIVCVQPQLIQSNVVDHPDLQPGSCHLNMTLHSSNRCPANGVEHYL